MAADYEPPINTKALPTVAAAGSARRKWQFSLRGVAIVVLVLCIVLAIAAQFPRVSAFTASMTLLVLIPLVVVALVRSLLLRLGLGDRPGAGEVGASHGRIARILLAPLEWLGLWQPTPAPSILSSLTTAILSMLTLIGLWPAARELGLQAALLSLQPMAYYSWENAGNSVVEAFSSGGYWLRLWQWEAWSADRWWLLFWAILIGWLLASAPFRRWLKAEPVPATLARFLAFAPWIIVLECCFLIGVWIESPNTVPEPSTGFVVGIFDWSLWDWDCWQNRGWLIRGAVPTFVAGTMFFLNVLRRQWPWALLAALLLVPVALLLSVACTVAYQNGWPPLFQR